MMLSTASSQAVQDSLLKCPNLLVIDKTDIYQGICMATSCVCVSLECTTK